MFPLHIIGHRVSLGVNINSHIHEHNKMFVNTKCKMEDDVEGQRMVCHRQHPLTFFSRVFFSKLCSGKAMAIYTKSQQWKEEESEQLRGEGDQIKLINLRF